MSRRKRQLAKRMQNSLYKEASGHDCALAAGRARSARCASNAGESRNPGQSGLPKAGNAQILHFNEKKLFRDII